MLYNLVFRQREVVRKFCSLTMDAAKKAAGYTAIDRHVKVFDFAEVSS